jgi:hypothetical protein
MSVLAPKTDAAANSRTEATQRSEVPLCSTVRLAAYERLVEFAVSLTLNEGPPAVEVFEQQGMGLGLRVSRDVPRGGHVAYYGGAYQPIRRQRGPSRSHSLQVVDHTVPPGAQDPSVIDGKMVAAIFRDPVANEAQRAAVLPIAGALINSVDENEKRPADVKLSSADALFMSVNGVRFAAKSFTAARDLSKGETLLWRYKINQCTEPLVFADPLRELREQPQPTKRSRLEPQRLSTTSRTTAAPSPAGSMLPVQSFVTQHPPGRFLVGQCPVLAAATPPLCELGLQWAGEGSLAPEEYIGEYTGLEVGATDHEDLEEALRALLAPFGGLAPTRYCLALRRVDSAGWRLVDALESPTCFLKFANSSRGTGLPPTFTVDEFGCARALAAGTGFCGSLEPCSTAMCVKSRLTWDYGPLLACTLPVPRTRLRLAYAERLVSKRVIPAGSVADARRED